MRVIFRSSRPNAGAAAGAAPTEGAPAETGSAAGADRDEAASLPQAEIKRRVRKATSVVLAFIASSERENGRPDRTLQV